MTDQYHVPTWFEAEAGVWQNYESILASGVPFDHGQFLRNLRLWEVPGTVARVLWFQHLYEQIREVPGEILEFGVLWGGDMMLWDNLRTINEPGMQGSLRGLYGFDTFAGHAGASPADGDDELAQDGAFTVPDGYVEWLQHVINVRRTLFRNGRFELVEGDVRVTVPTWLDENPHRSVALAYLDLDLYEPTLAVMESIIGRVPPGGIIAFDEYNNGKYPGETMAAHEVLAGWGRVQRWQGSSGGWCWWVKP